MGRSHHKKQSPPEPGMEMESLWAKYQSKLTEIMDQERRIFEVESNYVNDTMEWVGNIVLGWEKLNNGTIGPFIPSAQPVNDAKATDDSHPNSKSQKQHHEHRASAATNKPKAAKKGSHSTSLLPEEKELILDQHRMFSLSSASSPAEALLETFQTRWNEIEARKSSSQAGHHHVDASGNANPNSNANAKAGNGNHATNHTNKSKKQAAASDSAQAHAKSSQKSKNPTAAAAKDDTKSSTKNGNHRQALAERASQQPRSKTGAFLPMNNPPTQPRLRRVKKDGTASKPPPPKAKASDRQQQQQQQQQQQSKHDDANNTKNESSIGKSQRLQTKAGRRFAQQQLKLTAFTASKEPEQDSKRQRTR